MSKPSAFISYAHKDAMEFTRRFAFALSMYMEVYWDRRLQTGEFAPQLFAEIDACDFFVLVLSPYSLREDGWCRKELEHAQQQKSDRIVLARLYRDSGFPEFEQELGSLYTWGDFTEDFEAGFRRITGMVLGRPYSSWEALSQANDKQLLDYLKSGYLPGLIAKEIVEWIIVERLWPSAEQYADKNELVFKGSPRTLTGSLRQSNLLIKQFAQFRDALGAHLARQVIEIVEPLVRELASTSDDDHAKAGETAFYIIDKVRSILSRNGVAARDFHSAVYTQKGYYNFDVTEKLRELISLHARRSRYLY